MLKLKLQLLWPPDAKNRLIGKDQCWERLKAERQSMRWLNGTTYMMDKFKLQELVMDREAWSATVCGVTRFQTLVTELELLG